MPTADQLILTYSKNAKAPKTKKQCTVNNIFYFLIVLINTSLQQSAHLQYVSGSNFNV